MTLKVISPEIYSYVRSCVNSWSLEDIQNAYLSQTYEARESNDCLVKVEKSIKYIAGDIQYSHQMTLG